MPRATFLLFAVACLLASAGSAFAGTASVTNTTLVYEAAVGEVNDVTLTLTIGPQLVFEVRDATVPVTAGDACVSLDVHAVECTVGGYSQVIVRAGDLDDMVSAALISTECDDCDAGPIDFVALRGGPGSDVLIGGQTNMELYGGAGDDMLHGGDWSDFLAGGAGADRIDGGANTLLAGPYLRDLVSYASYRAPVSVDGDGVADDGAVGEGDNVVNVEGAVGGAGDDRLVGNAQPNILAGGQGQDFLWGGMGGDRLSGGPQPDVIRAGRGNDQVEGELGDDWIVGGPGTDEMYGGDLDGSDGIFEGAVPDRRGDDTILAGPGPDFVNGQGGADRIFGGNGDDSLLGHRGRDRLIGDKGRDKLFAWRDRAADRVFGGPDRDEAWVDSLDVLRDVERVHRR